MNQRLDPVPVVARSRVRPPEPSPDEVERPRLLQLLDADSAPVTLVAAPQGAGKSVLLAQWARRQRGRCAWVSLLGGHEGSLVGVWAAVLEALRHVDGGLELPRLSGLADPDHVLDRVIPGLLNCVADTEPLSLVLDGLDSVVDSSARDSLVYFLRQVPRHVRVLMSSSRPASGPLLHLRGTGRLHELPADALRFTNVEAQELLRRTTGNVIAWPAVEGLNARLDGWAVGLSIAGRHPGAIDGQRIPDAVLDYVRLEVLEEAPARQRAALVRTSVLSRLRCGAVSAVAGRGMARALDSFADSTLLLRRDPDGWVCHPALRAAASEELRRTQPVQRAGLQARAVRHLAAAWPAADPASIVEVMGQLSSGEAEQVACVGAAAALALGSAGQAQQLLSISTDTPARPAVLALAYLESGDLSAVRRVIESVHGRRPGVATTWHDVLFDVVIGAMELWADRPGQGVWRLEEAAAAAALTGYQDAHVRALDHLVACADLTGDSERALSIAREATELFRRDPSGSAPPVISAAYLEGDLCERAELSPGRDRLDWRGSPHAVAFAAYLRASAARRWGDQVGFRVAQAEGRSALTPDSAGPLLRALLADGSQDRDAARLTDRELVVLRALCGPLTLREIARELHVSHNTIKTQVGSLFRKLCVNDRPGALRAARDRRLLPR